MSRRRSFNPAKDLQRECYKVRSVVTNLGGHLRTIRSATMGALDGRVLERSVYRQNSSQYRCSTL